MTIPNKPEKTTNSPAPNSTASSPTSKPRGIERPPVREPVVSNENFHEKNDILGPDDL